MIFTRLPKLLLPTLLTLTTLLNAPNATAQTAAADGTMIEFPAREMTLSDAFRHIEAQTPFRFAFTGDRLDVGRTVELPATQTTVTEAVTGLLADTDYTYTLRQTHFIIVPRIEQTEPRAVTPAPSPILIADGELKRFVPDQPGRVDSVVRRTVEAGPFRFGAQDNTFVTPGAPFPGGEVPQRFATATRVQRSKFAIKTNLLQTAAFLAPNLRAEIGLGNRTTLEAGVGYNGWNLRGTDADNRKLVHGFALGEFRYWLCERFNGHFFGVHAFGGFYNVGGRDVPLLFDKQYRYEGTAYGAGVSYGYFLPFAPRWGAEFNVGVGFAQLKYAKYGCAKCDDKVDDFNKTYFGPTRAGISLVFIIK